MPEDIGQVKQFYLILTGAYRMPLEVSGIADGGSPVRHLPQTILIRDACDGSNVGPTGQSLCHICLGVPRLVPVCAEKNLIMFTI